MDEKYKSISKQHIDELIAIYEDFLYLARAHESVMQLASIEDLACSQLESMHPDAPKISWQIMPMSPQDRQDFVNFVNNDEYEDENRAYVILHHIKQHENNGYFKNFAIPPYTVTSLNMQLPFNLERCTVIYTPTSELGKTDFFVDGIYKMKYIDKENANMPLLDFIYNNDMLGEFSINIAQVDALWQNKDATEKSYNRMYLNIYAAEQVVANENIILELLGSFAEKLLVVCREIYDTADSDAALKQAESDGLIPSADNFKDYVNIRNFMRHQLDTLDELGFFDADKANKNKIIRSTYVESYLKICDKTPIYRMKAYIDVLHQMQHVMRKICPNRLIRDTSESNNKFFQRVRTAYANPDAMCPGVELNHPIASDKYKSLNRNLRKIIPTINIVDDFPLSHGRDIGIDYYGNRSRFLNTFHASDCIVMRHCMTRGRNLRSYEAWQHIKKLGLLSPQESKTWQDYAVLRNKLSHNYFSKELRNLLLSKEEQFLQDAQVLMNTLISVGPDVTKLRDGVYEYAHKDGLVAHLDFKNHKILYQNRPSIENCKYTFPNGMEIGVYNGLVTNVKLPNGIIINLQTQTINWDEHTMWHTIKDCVNVLQTARSKIYTGPDLRVTKYMECGSKIPFGKGDSILIDRRHHVALDSMCRIKEFKFKNTANVSISTTFSHTKDGCNLISFMDGTTVTQSENGMTVAHNGVTLTYDNRDEFALTYSIPQMTPVVQTAVKNYCH